MSPQRTAKLYQSASEREECKDAHKIHTRPVNSHKEHKQHRTLEQRKEVESSVKDKLKHFPLARDKENRLAATPTPRSRGSREKRSTLY